MDSQNGYVRKLEERELAETKDERQWYVPKHPVINPHKPKKVKCVCNAAAKYERESLNDKLLTGPDLLINLGIIFRFREHQHAMTADIEALILKMKVLPGECRVIRFLWRNKPEDKTGVYEYTRHIFGAKSSPTCAKYALLQAGVGNQDDHPIAARAIKRNFYMDDFAKSVATVEEAVHVYHDVRTTLQKRGFNLLKGICNNELVTRSIPEKDKSEAKSKAFEAEPHTSSLLGMQWNVDNGVLEICRGADKEVPTRSHNEQCCRL